MDMMTSRAAWLAERRKGIGGSDVAPILGVSPYRTRLDVFLEKRGDLVDQPENDAMRWGNLLEPVVRQEYSNVTGRSVMLPPGMLRHDRYAFMLANLDGFTEDGRIYEGKTARTADSWGEPGTDEIPQGYLFQVQHYMAVTGYPVADVAVLIGGSDFRIYTVEADKELHELLIYAEADFWQRVTDNDPPEPVTISDAISLWGRSSSAKCVTASPEAERAVESLKVMKEQISALEAEIDVAKMSVMCALGEADTLVDANGKALISWKAAKPVKRIDSKALKEAHPDIHDNFLVEAEAVRRFLIK